jgi:hypothetical protein
MSRNLGDVRQDASRGEFVEKSINFQNRFGIAVVQVEAWLSGALNFLSGQTFNEEFIGAYPNIEGYPYLAVDYGPGSLLEIRYPRMFPLFDHEFVGLPGIGVGERTLLAAPLYLYISRDGDKSIFHGKVNSVLLQNGDMRTACFMFTPLAIDPDPMQQVFNTILPWLSEKFENPSSTGGAPKLQVPANSTSFMSVSERRDRINEFLQYLDENADLPEVQRIQEPIKPYELSPSSAIR